MSSKQSMHVAIIGGGVEGCSIGYHLGKAGIRATIIEQKEVAAEASSAAAGLLAPVGVLTGPAAAARLFLASWSIMAAVIAEIEAASGIQVEAHRTGALHVIENENDERQMRKYAQIWQEHGEEVAWLSADEIHQYEPLLRPAITSALYVPHALSIRPRLMTMAYAGAARKGGVQIYEHTEVTGIERSANRVTGLKTSNGVTISCDLVVIAAGAWSAGIGEWFHLQVPVAPARGQILSLRQPAPPLAHTIFGQDIYLVPKVDDTIYVGATVEQVGFDKSNTAGGLHWLLSSALQLVPALEQAQIVSIWAGLRPMSTDGYPILGKAPSWDNVILATGHGAGGFELSAITGQTIAELITTGQVPAVIQPFGIERFMHA